jgi:hypothetical protein
MDGWMDMDGWEDGRKKKKEEIPNKPQRKKKLLKQRKNMT